MSDFADKIEQRPRSQGGKAQATRKQLLARRGSREDGTKTITIDTMGGRELWRCISGDVFEQEVRS
jgi:hypothetical protein